MPAAPYHPRPSPSRAPAHQHLGRATCCGAPTWHSPPVHLPFWQSMPELHSLPSAHLVGQILPQSISASPPFFTKSLQLGACRRDHRSGLRPPLPTVYCARQHSGTGTLSGQSRPGARPLPFEQLPSRPAPPAPATSAGLTWHSPPEHTPVVGRQAGKHQGGITTRKPRPDGNQPAKKVLAQPSGTSAPARRTARPKQPHHEALHILPEAQSPAMLQLLDVAHLVGHTLPQSTSASAPFFTPSLHDGACSSSKAVQRHILFLTRILLMHLSRNAHLDWPTSRSDACWQSYLGVPRSGPSSLSLSHRTCSPGCMAKQSQAQANP